MMAFNNKTKIKLGIKRGRIIDTMHPKVNYLKGCLFKIILDMIYRMLHVDIHGDHTQNIVGTQQLRILHIIIDITQFDTHYDS